MFHLRATPRHGFAIAGASLMLAVGALGAASPARAERWFGSVSASCDSFGECFATPDSPDRPADSALLHLLRSGKANAPLEFHVTVNKPVEGGVAIRLETEQGVIALAAGSDVLTRRETYNGRDYLMGYFIADARATELLAMLRRATSARIVIAVAGEPQTITVNLNGLDEALRYFDEHQGRTGAQDALIEKGPRKPADAAAPRPLPAKDAWPREIAAIFAREKCEDEIATFDSLKEGFVAAPAPGRELWQIPCAGGNYNILFTLVEVRNGDMKSARALRFPTRLHKRSDSVLVNPSWWDARKELWAFEHGRAFGDCGTVTRYRWTPAGFSLLDQRRKDDCDGKSADPWTKWPVAKSRRAGKR